MPGRGGHRADAGAATRLHADRAQTARCWRSAARDAGVTLNAVLSAALALVLGYETGSDDVVFGITVAGRPTEVDGLDSVIGLFLNTVPDAGPRCAPGRSVADDVRRRAVRAAGADGPRLPRPRRHPARTAGSERSAAALRQPLRAAELPRRRHVHRHGGRARHRRSRFDRRVALPADLGGLPGRATVGQVRVPARRGGPRRRAAAAGPAAAGVAPGRSPTAWPTWRRFRWLLAGRAGRAGAARRSDAATTCRTRPSMDLLAERRRAIARR